MKNGPAFDTYIRAYTLDTYIHTNIHTYVHTYKQEEEEEEEEEESLFKADAVNEEDPERDRATQV